MSENSSVTTVWGCAVDGVRGVVVEVETHAVSGLPRFSVVGLPAPSVRESLDRVLSALRSSDLTIPSGRVTVNLAPADVRKDGSALDLPIAVGLAAAGGASIPSDRLQRCMVAGELALDGSLRSVRGVLPMALAAEEAGIEAMIVPAPNAREAAAVPSLAVSGARTLVEVVADLIGNRELRRVAPARERTDESEDLEPRCLSEVRGQAHAKRALEIAAAGKHHLLMSGPPGTGKTMLARRLPGLLPPLTDRERLEATAIHSVAGTLDHHRGVLIHPPFRAPHHTTSRAGLAGGGQPPGPGEISLAHHGVLHLDELPEFSRAVLEVLRQPLERGTITLSRARYVHEYPARFVLVASMNPCPCGYEGHPDRACTCSAARIHRYRDRISGPLLDRFDLHVDLGPVRIEALEQEARGPSSAEVRRRVQRARTIQRKRFSEGDTPRSDRWNGSMTPADLDRCASLQSSGRALLRKAASELGLTARSYHKIMKIARSIADLEAGGPIREAHVAEAIQYRSIDRHFVTC